MNRAVIAQEGAPRDLYEAPVDRFVADFIGDANIVKAEIRAVSGDVAEVRVDGLALTLPHRPLSPGTADVADRPEPIRIVRQRTAAPCPADTLRNRPDLQRHPESTPDTPTAQTSPATT